MTARTRARPRTTPARKNRRGTVPIWKQPVAQRVGLVAAAAAFVLFVALFYLVDVPAALADLRDWLLGTFGVGLAILAVLSAFGGFAISRRSYLGDRGRFARRAGGAVALGLFAWGVFGLNEADWSLGGVDFARVSLGGEVGQAFVSGVLGKLAWLSAGVLAAGLLFPGPTRAFARNAPLWLKLAWERRLPHRAGAFVVRVCAVFGRAISFTLGRPDTAEDEGPVIDATLRAHATSTTAGPLDATPVLFRPAIERNGPSSAVGAGAAARFGGATTDEMPAPLAEDVPEPEPEPAPVLKEPTPAMEDAPPPDDRPLILGRPGGWHLPTIDLLTEPKPSASRKHDNAARAQLIVDTLDSFGVDASVVEINEGPTVTQFGVEPGWEVRYKDLLRKDENGKTMIGADGRQVTERIEQSRTRVRVNRITALQNDLALALAAPSLRIEAPVPGRAIVGIEVPNDSATVVTMRTVMETKEFSDLERKSKLALALGKGVSGTPVVADLAKMPHLLIAGATGSGKSVCINAIIAGIMMNATPDEVRFVMVDPKRVELTAYGTIPHLAFSEVIVDMDKVVGTLQAVISEMEARYKKFAAVGVRNLESYNRHHAVLKKLPFWVVIIDELADLMMVAPFEVEKLLCRLAQLARATGIHLVVATQRPSVDVVTGLIKANFPTRIAFAVTSMTDSRTILDMGGAEKLLGKGDMLFMPTDAAKPIRIQGVYLSDAEVERLVAFWTDDRFAELAPETADNLLHEALKEQNGDDEEFEVEEDDPMLADARQLASQHQRISPSMVQRRLRCGYVKAASLISALEAEGIVGPREEGESRRVLPRPEPPEEPSPYPDPQSILDD